MSENIMKVENSSNAVMTSRQVNSGPTEDEKLKKACGDFEAIYTGLMLKTMRSTVPEDSLFGSSNQKEIFQSMFDQELANTIAHSDKSLGIGDLLYEKLTREK